MVVVSLPHRLKSMLFAVKMGARGRRVLVNEMDILFLYIYMYLLV